MEIVHRTNRDSTVIEIAGPFAFSNRKDFTAALDAVKRTHSRHVILNLARVTFVDSSAIGLLALTAQQMKSSATRFSLVGAQGTVKQVLELMQIHRMIPMYANEDAALDKHAA
ncbi:MAG: STAS domain-containing protein [Nitrospira sp.]